MGGWVNGEVEEERAVGMRCCGWVGGGGGYLEGELNCVAGKDRGNHVPMFRRAVLQDLGGWVGGCLIWVGG